MNVPNDCLVVDIAKDVSHFTVLTWNSRDSPKTIPVDIYEQVSEKLIVVEDPHNLLKKEEEKVAPKEEEKPKPSKVKTGGKSKSKKNR